MRVLAVIAARGGSTRIPGKNLAYLGPYRLVEHAAISAMQARSPSRVVISTDDEEIARPAQQMGAFWILRPQALSGATAMIEDATKHALLYCERAFDERYDYVVVLQAAVPIRPAGAIDALVKAVVDEHAGGGVTVIRRTPWTWNVIGHTAQVWWPAPTYPRSQDVRGTVLEEINSIMVTPRDHALDGRRWGTPMALLELPAWADADIDVQADLDLARSRWHSTSELLDGARICPIQYPIHIVSDLKTGIF